MSSVRLSIPVVFALMVMLLAGCDAGTVVR